MSNYIPNPPNPERDPRAREGCQEKAADQPASPRTKPSKPSCVASLPAAARLFAVRESFGLVGQLSISGSAFRLQRAR